MRKSVRKGSPVVKFPFEQEQFDSVRAGDWFCKCHSNERGNKPWAYFWDSEVLQSETSSTIEDKVHAIMTAGVGDVGVNYFYGKKPSPAQDSETIDSMKLRIAMRELKATRDNNAQLRSQLRNWETWGTVEIAVRNPNVDSYMKHWEGRALAAEEKVAELEGRIANALL